MKICLVSLNAGELLDLMRQRAAQSQHSLVDDPASADLILLAGSFGSQPELLLHHALYQSHPDRCVVYTEDDNYLPLAPGVYCSAVIDEHSRAGRIFSYSYISRAGQFSNPFIGSNGEEVHRAPTLLFSFQGGSTSILRKRLFNLSFSRADCLIENTSTYYHWDLAQPGRLERQQRYADTVANSHFVLCPRGAGTGSIRLFEVMAAGIAPVLIADNYLLPFGPDWNQFLICIPESQISRLPELLEPHRASSGERGRLAREAWNQYFSPDREFDGIVAACSAAAHHGPPAESVFRKLQSRTIARAHRRRQLRAFARAALLRTLKILHLKSPYAMNR